jgi:hypothetical protein
MVVMRPRGLRERWRKRNLAFATVDAGIALDIEMATTLSILDLARLLCLLLVASCAAFAIASYWRRPRAPAVPVQPKPVERTPSTGIVYHDAPTVRVVDSQRVDRLRKVVRMHPGEFVDVLQTRAGSTPRFRVTLKGLVSLHDADAAHILVEFGGTPVSCGPLVQEIASNEFFVPRAGREEPRSSVFHYHEHGDKLEFMRIKVRSIDPDSGSAELDMMQVLGTWPAG